MILKVYSIHDSAVQSFLTPHFARTHGEAERNFKVNVRDKENGHLHTSPENFTLFHIGDYDDQTGEMKPLAAPMSVITGIQCKDLQ